jgi:WXG100 family type VII secretion target
MDVNINYNDVDSTVAAFLKGAESLSQVSAALRKIMQSYQTGGFQGQSADNYAALMERKIALVDKLRETYETAAQKLQDAKSSMQDTDSQLKARVGAI